MTTDHRLQRALDEFAALHDQDPRTRADDGRQRPVERVWCDAVSRWVQRLEPEASTALRLAAAAQHLERWKLPRQDWPEGRAGYLRWRKFQQQAHADRAEEVLLAAGFEAELIDRVRQLLRKQQLARDPEVQVLEDAICLAFLELDLDDFASRHAREDVVRILRKTWGKMSARGQQVALQLELSETTRELVGEALEAPAGE